ncbi:MAG: hypothetical protein KME21_24240 [Desmonostoc vinosum HA7617-LM4]|nr:hypothetical protein [Desmonostoc vinosum HA7617-LM4]
MTIGIQQGIQARAKPKLHIYVDFIKITDFKCYKKYLYKNNNYLMSS